MTSERPVDRVGPALLGALVPLAFLAVDPTGWFPFGPAKWLAVSLLGSAGAAAVLATRRVSVPGPLLVAIAVWVVGVAAAAAVGHDPLYAWIGTPERHLGVATWLLCAALLLAGSSLAPGVTAVLWGLAAAGVGVGAVATAEALGWEPAELDVGRRLTGTFGSAAYLGAATALLLPVLAGLAGDRALDGRLRAAAAAALPLLAVACLGSGARAAWFGLVIAAVVTAWARRAWVRSHAGTMLAGVALLAVAVLLSPAADRLAALGDADAAGGQGRLDEWRVASRVVLDHPVTGVGPEGYRIAFAEGVDPAYEREHGRDQQPDRAHSAPLDIALSAGLPGLAAWLALVGLVGRSVLAALRSGPAWRRGVAAGLVAHLAGQLLLFPLAELEPIAWLLAGVVVGSRPSVSSFSVDLLDQERGRRPENVLGGRDVPLAARIGAGLLAAGAVVALVAGITDVRADRRAGSAADALARGDTQGAADASVDAADQRPDVVRLHVLAAAAVVADEQGALAGLRHLERALDVSPGDPIVLLARARLLVDRAEATQVPAHITAASDELGGLLGRDPNNAALWAAAARLEALRGDSEAAARAQQRADDLHPADPAYDGT